MGARATQAFIFKSMAGFVCVWRRRHAWQTAEQELHWGKRIMFKLGGRRGRGGKRIDFLQSEGAWPRNYKPANKKTLIIFLNAYFKVFVSLTHPTYLC